MTTEEWLETSGMIKVVRSGAGMSWFSYLE